MKNYELTYLISPDFSEEEIKALQEKIVSQIQEIGGVLGEVSGSIKKILAHPIKRRISAFSATLSFQLPPEKLDLLHKRLKLESNILRYLILGKPARVSARKKVPEVTIKPKKLAKPKVELKEIEKKLEEILGE